MRHWEVMATGRTLLLCDRATDLRTYGSDILEDEHAVMFETEEEFLQKVTRYARNESARMAIVQRAYRWALAKHDWKHRGATMHSVIRQHCAAAMSSEPKLRLAEAPKPTPKPTPAPTPAPH